MEHLHNRSLIHRDLATRNVLLCDRGDRKGCGAVVKLTDYGLTKGKGETGAYYGGTTDLPVLWMAPEALQRRKFTEKTDVWAFGVTLWELLTDGSFPYWQWAEANDAAIIARVCAGEVSTDKLNAAMWCLVSAWTRMLSFLTCTASANHGAASVFGLPRMYASEPRTPAAVAVGEQVMDVPDRTNEAGQVETCPKAVYDVLRSTWHFQPEDRPSFQTVGAMLAALTT